MQTTIPMGARTAGAILALALTTLVPTGVAMVWLVRPLLPSLLAG